MRYNPAKFGLIFATLFCGWQIRAADLQSGEVFADGQSVTGARLNNAVNGATILPAFIANKSPTVPVGADSFIFYQAGSGSLLRSTLSNIQTAVLAVPSFTGTTTVTQDFDFTGLISPTQIVADTNDYAPTGFATSTILRVSTDALRNFTGLAGGTAGRFIIWMNVGSFPEQINNENASSATGNRFDFENSLDDIILPGGSRTFVYDGTSLRWRCLSRYYSPSNAFITLTDGATITLACDATKYSQNAIVTLAGSRELAFTGLAPGMSGILIVVQDGTGSRKLALPGPSFSDGVGATSTTFTSATATFVAGDVGRPICESGNTHIPAGATISSVTNGTTIVASASISTGTGITFYLPGRLSHVTGGGKGAVVLSTTAASIDILSWVYDGTFINWTYGKNFN